MKSTSSSFSRAYASVASCGSSIPASSTVEAWKAKDDLMSLVLDFKCKENPDALVTDKVIADFIFDELKLQRSEITGLVQLGGGNGQRSVRVETVHPFDVNERFGDNLHYQRMVIERKWLCSIRKANSASYLRFFNVPGWITNEELLSVITSFAKPLATMEKECFGKFQDPRLSGLTNGHRRVLVTCLGIVPDFISLGLKKIRIYHRDQVPKCFTCHQAGHMKANCPTNQELLKRPSADLTDNLIPQELQQDDHSTSESDNSVVFEDCTKEDMEPKLLTSEELSTKGALAPAVENKDNQARPDTEVIDGELLEATNNLELNDPDQALSPHQKRKLPSSVTTPVAKDAKISKKKGRTEKEIPLKTVITRSETSTL